MSGNVRIAKGKRRVMVEHVSGIGRRGIDEGRCQGTYDKVFLGSEQTNIALGHTLRDKFRKVSLLNQMYHAL